MCNRTVSLFQGRPHVVLFAESQIRPRDGNMENGCNGKDPWSQLAGAECYSLWMWLSKRYMEAAEQKVTSEQRDGIPSCMLLDGVLLTSDL